MPRKPNIPSYDEDEEPIAFVGALIGLAVTGLLELLMLLLFYGTYNETLGLMPGLYLCDLPGAGAIACQLTPDMTVSNLLAFLLAVFSIAVPIVIWGAVLEQRILQETGAWLDSPGNRVWLVLGILVYALVFALETVNLYTLIAQHSSGPGVFATTQEPNAMMDMLSQNKALGVFVAAMIAVVNAVLAFIAVRSARNLKRAIRS